MNNKSKANNLIGISLVLIVLVFYLIYSLLMPKIKENREKKSLLSVEIQKGQEKIDKLAEAKAKLPELKSIIDTVNLAIPEGRDYQSIIVSLEAIAAKNAIALDNFQPDSSVGQDGAEVTSAALTFTVNVSGDYEKVNLFIHDLEKNLRIFKIKTLAFSAGENNAITTSISAEAYSNDLNKE